MGETDGEKRYEWNLSEHGDRVAKAMRKIEDDKDEGRLPPTSLGDVHRKFLRGRRILGEKRRGARRDAGGMVPRHNGKD